MNAAELRARTQAKHDAILATIDATLDEVTFGDFLVAAIGQSEAMAIRDAVATAKALYDSEGCYFNRESE